MSLDLLLDRFPTPFPYAHTQKAGVLCKSSPRSPLEALSVALMGWFDFDSSCLLLSQFLARYIKTHTAWEYGFLNLDLEPCEWMQCCWCSGCWWGLFSTVR